MAQDIRELVRNRPEEHMSMPAGHQGRFAEKLNKAFQNEPKQAKGANYFLWGKVAAVAVVFLAVGFFGYQYMAGLENGNDVTTEFAGTTAENESNTTYIEKQPKLTLGDLSPEFKKVETFYQSGINAQLASIRVNEDNKELIDGYMKRIAELDTEYNRLNNELYETGPTEATINALMDNLKLRLDLLFKLKNKLKELKNLDDEKFNNLQA